VILFLKAEPKGSAVFFFVALHFFLGFLEKSLNFGFRIPLHFDFVDTRSCHPAFLSCQNLLKSKSFYLFSTKPFPYKYLKSLVVLVWYG